MSACTAAAVTPTESPDQGIHLERRGSVGPVRFRTADDDTVVLSNFYAGRSCFLVCGGPSLKDVNLGLLAAPGVVTWALNNSVAVLDQMPQRIRPRFWTCVDAASRFHDRIYRDPAITKVLPLRIANHQLRCKPGGQWAKSKWRVRDMPAVLFWQRSSMFDPETFFTEPGVCWGCDDAVNDPLGILGVRSVMLAAVKLVHAMGFRTLYLLGADFKMEKGKENYAAGQGTDQFVISHNNRTYKALNIRFESLKPYMEFEGMRVFNCTPSSGLTAFPYKPLWEAVKEATAECAEVIDAATWYDNPPDLKAEREKVEREWWAYFRGGGD